MAQCRTETIKLKVEKRQVEDCLSALLHTILFYRSTCKMTCRKEGTYTFGALGMKDVECDYVNCTYVRCSSESLCASLTSQVKSFVDQLNSKADAQTAQVCLQFLEKPKSSSWFGGQPACWEEWVISFNIVNLSNERERQAYREDVGRDLAAAMQQISTTILNVSYVPDIPRTAETLDSVFDTAFEDVMPYLNKVLCSIDGENSATVGGQLSRFLRGTFKYQP